MSERRDSHTARRTLRAQILQLTAMLLCVALGLAMILNNQMGGEAMWFWYATTFHRDVRLYADLHIALQPLFVLLTDAWMTLFGNRLWITQIPSLLEICTMCLALLLLLRESDWPDWAKAITLIGAFSLTITGSSYRFDDYHVLTENLLYYCMLTLLVLARTEAPRRQLALVTVLGLLSGLMITTRLTDGVALLTSAALCLSFLLPRRRVLSVAILTAVALLVVVVVVQLTGDTLSAYLSSSIFRAAASKGGTGSIFAAPFLVIRNVVPVFLLGGKRALIGWVVALGAGFWAARNWKQGLRYVLIAQLTAALLVFVALPFIAREPLLHNVVVTTMVLVLIPLLYAVSALVLARFAGAGPRPPIPFDRREILVLVPLAEWASYSAGAAAEPLTSYYAPLALFLLLLPILQRFRANARWLQPSFLTVMAVFTLSTFAAKAVTPYAWQNYRVAPMFANRDLYHHPVYGEMYIDRDLLRFSTTVCSDIGARPGVTHPELLSLPYPFPNYFCDTPPWHNDVQTFFDTSTRAAVEQLMRELNTAPPQWIVYQRQLLILRGAERLYNHGKPLPQRDLDTLIAQKLSSGQWTLVDQSNYLGHEGGGWFIIRTGPDR